MIRARVVFTGAGVVAAVAVFAGQVVAAGGQTAGAVHPAAKKSVAGRCQANALGISLTDVGAYSFHTGLTIEFKNRGSACTITGYPGVDALRDRPADSQRQADQVRLYRRRLLGPDPEGVSRQGEDGLRARGVGGRRTARSAVSPCALAQDHSARRGQLGDLVAEVAQDRDSLPRPGLSGRSRAQRTEDLRALDGEKGKGHHCVSVFAVRSSDTAPVI